MADGDLLDTGDGEVFGQVQALSSAVQYQNLDFPGLLASPEVGEVGRGGARRERHSPRVGGTFGGESEQEVVG